MNNKLYYNSEPILRAMDLHKSYYRVTEVPVLRGVDLEVRQGEFVSIIGSSGSGKSTLLQLLGTLDEPTQGEIYWRDRRVDHQPPRFRDQFRNEVVGFIFQFYHLLPELSTLENVMLPAYIQYPALQYWRHQRRIQQNAKELLVSVGLSHRMHHKPNELSGGEMQRAAIARALLSRPQILLADEPTGNLDDETGYKILELLEHLRTKIELTIIMVTHDTAIAKRADRVLRLVQGQLVREDFSSRKDLHVVA